MARRSHATLLKFRDQTHSENIGIGAKIQWNEGRLIAGLFGRITGIVGFFG